MLLINAAGESQDEPVGSISVSFITMGSTPEVEVVVNVVTMDDTAEGMEACVCTFYCEILN